MHSLRTTDSPPHTSGKWLGVLVAGAVAICLAPVLLRVAADRGVGPVAVAFWRVALALPFLAGAALVRRPKRASVSAALADRKALLFAAAAGACFGVDLMF